MEGTLTLFYSHVRALFDTSASNSFIVVRMMNDLGIVPHKLKTVLNVVSPLEQPLSWVKYVRIVI